MNKKILLPILGLALSSSIAFGVAQGAFAEQPQTKDYIVDFFNNYAREDLVLSNGTKAKGNNLLYKSVVAKGLGLLEKPEDPTRKNYDFAGWYKETSCENEWNFATDQVESNLRLYAKWTYSTAQEDNEPPYTPPSTVLDNSAETDYVINSVMNFAITDNQVKLPTAALAKLAAASDNVLPLMEYKVKANKAITATYENNKITVTCGEDSQVITVKDDSVNLILENGTYETKAKNYEAKALEEESYHVMLAGSSSIEFWTTSKEDLDPITSYNHGIGGTTIEEWTNSLNQRLVYPYKPKMVVYYVGINNVINSKQSAETIWGHLEKFFNDTHAALPDTKVQYILMNQLTGYSDYHDTICAVNNQAVIYQKDNPWLTLINPGLSLLKSVEGANGVLPVGTTVNTTFDIELSAVWEDGEEPASNAELTNQSEGKGTETKFKVHFNPNGGTGEMPTIEKTDNKYTLPECSFTAPAGKHFAGWRVYGEPNHAYFRTDGLHLSYYGYVVWGAVIKQSILRGLENN